MSINRSEDTNKSFFQLGETRGSLQEFDAAQGIDQIPLDAIPAFYDIDELTIDLGRYNATFQNPQDFDDAFDHFKDLKLLRKKSTGQIISSVIAEEDEEDEESLSESQSDSGRSTSQEAIATKKQPDSHPEGSPVDDGLTSLSGSQIEQVPIDKASGSEGCRRSSAGRRSTICSSNEGHQRRLSTAPMIFDVAGYGPKFTLTDNRDFGLPIKKAVIQSDLDVTDELRPSDRTLRKLKVILRSPMTMQNLRCKEFGKATEAWRRTQILREWISSIPMRDNIPEFLVQITDEASN